MESEALKKAKESAIDKKQKREELRNDLNKDPWGLHYKIVLRKSGGNTLISRFTQKLNGTHSFFHSMKWEKI